MGLQNLYNRILKVRNRHFFALDLVAFMITPFLALVIRLDWNFDLSNYFPALFYATALFLLLKVGLFIPLGLYKRYWQYASIDEVIRLLLIGTTVLVCQTILFTVFYYADILHFDTLPFSLPILDGVITLLFIGLTRLSIRIIERFNERIYSEHNFEKILVIGAGKAGISIVQEMQRNPQLGYAPVGYIDDDKQKLGVKIRGVPVLGNREHIRSVIKDYNVDKVWIAMPTVSGSQIRDIVALCKKIGVKTKIIPGIYELLDETVRIDSIREVQIEDLLRRDVIMTDTNEVEKFVKGKRILVTGSGGSIGSELCRQILKFKPKELVLLGHGENSIFDVEQELERRIGLLSSNGYNPVLKTLIADIRFPHRIDAIFAKYRPEVVFHTAAHKHVPIMEANPSEAVTNNVLGTKILVESALRNGTENFVLISTDKAVNPTSIMGASKRIAEMIVLNYAKNFNKNYVAVRFGNVLGSRGSVIHTFRKQIKDGGPVTLTHPDIKRFFMTIPEATQLVLQASVLGKGGEIFVLDMGEPIKVIDLAADMIRLSGYEVEKDIKIEITGMRPGEKLFEELFIKEEKYEKTLHEKILIASNASNFCMENFDSMVEDLIELANNSNKSQIVYMLKKIIKEYEPAIHADLKETVAK
jgi:FlaA1/EpsC-like NDP-sugar epimerase